MDPVLGLLGACISAVFVWTNCDEDAFHRRLGSPNSMDLFGIKCRLACCFWPEDAIPLLTRMVRRPEDHHHWLPSVLEFAGVNRDIDTLMIQCAFLERRHDNPVPDVVVALAAAAWQGTGALADVVPRSIDGRTGPPGRLPVAARIALSSSVRDVSFRALVNGTACSLSDPACQVFVMTLADLPGPAGCFRVLLDAMDSPDSLLVWRDRSCTILRSP